MHPVLWGELIGFGLCFRLGFLMTRAAMGSLFENERWLQFLSGWGAGFGLCSLIWFWTWCRGSSVSILIPVAVEFLICLLLLQRRRTRQLRVRRTTHAAQNRLVWVAVMPFAAGAATYFGRLLWRAPYGWWDAWSIWNLHARAFFTGGGAVWKTTLPRISFSHPDYPLLLPLSVARIWFFAGREAASAPFVIAFGYTCATVMLLGLIVQRWKGSGAAILSVALLLSTREFVIAGASECADVIVSFYLLLAMVFLSLFESTQRYRFACLAGLHFGFAVWTKNEAGVFVLCLIASGALVWLSRPLRAMARAGAAFVLGIGPALITTLVFKRNSQSQSDVLSWLAEPGAWKHLTDGGRWLHLVQVIGPKTWSMEHWVVSWFIVLIVYVFLVGFDAQNPAPGITWLVSGVVPLYLLAICTVYLVSPQDLDWYVSTSLSRLYVQVWPIVLLAMFLATRSPLASLRRTAD